MMLRNSPTPIAKVHPLTVRPSPQPPPRAMGGRFELVNHGERDVPPHMPTANGLHRHREQCKGRRGISRGQMAFTEHLAASNNSEEAGETRARLLEISFSRRWRDTGDRLMLRLQRPEGSTPQTSLTLLAARNAFAWATGSKPSLHHLKNQAFSSVATFGMRRRQQAC